MNETTVSEFERREAERPVVARAFIQWKGTDVCMDITCPECNACGHVDGYFAYFVKCSSCNTVFQMNNFVAMHTPSETHGIQADDHNTQTF